MAKISDILKELGEAHDYDNEQKVIEMLKSSDKYKNTVKTSLMGTTTVEGDVGEIAAYVKTGLEAKKALEAAAKAEAAKAEAEYNAEVAKVLITSGYAFEGYKITRYSGYISGDDCVTMPRTSFFGNNKVEDNLCGSLVQIRRQALKELKEAAVDLGCNAVIGVDFDYIVLDPQHNNLGNYTTTVYEPYVICVTANGNAVEIEKTE